MWKYDKEKDYSKYENSYVTITYKVYKYGNKGLVRQMESGWLKGINNSCITLLSPDTYRFHKLIICNELIGELFKDNTLDFCLKIKTIRQNLKDKIISKTNSDMYTQIFSFLKKDYEII
tara:strand:+ start:128 stop:484 length:357 start_codon:yes stop_codon:yes gene_type:complete